MFLCHKCKRFLIDPKDDELLTIVGYCGCLSSYVRDWQVPTNREDTIKEVIEDYERTIKFLQQRNAPQQQNAHQAIEKCKKFLVSLNSLLNEG